MKHMIEFSPEELVLLENILERPVKHYFGFWNGRRFVYIFEQEEMERMARILYKAESDSFQKWLDLLKQLKDSGCDKPTQEMRVQWKYTGRIEEIYDRIAAPIGQSKRCSEEEEQEMLAYWESLEEPEDLEGWKK